jgi:hypothetical protein
MRFHPLDDVGSMQLREVRLLQQDYTALHSRKLSSSKQKLFNLSPYLVAVNTSVLKESTTYPISKKCQFS